jgi:WD40 repeat protein/tRNA A-37 threonylcarbamoyl transferase component Bud32/tetratricopeptide (TPR) repeat protein
MSTSSEDKVNALVSQWLSSRSQGQTLAPEQLCQDCPELLPALLRQIALLGRRDQFMGNLSDKRESISHVPSTTGEGATVDPRTVPPPDDSWTTKRPSAGAPSPGEVSSISSLPGYEIVGELGRGGMGVVLKARQQLLNRVVAIKMPLSAHLANSAERDRFVREARAAASLRHPHICPIFEVGQIQDRPFIVMGFIQGESLHVWSKKRSPSVRQIAEMVAVLARAIGHAHAHGVIHRDIKPANVMVEAETNQPVLMDFGLAKELTDEGSKLTQTGQIMGTPAYMAPEQAAGQAGLIGPLSDVYALGAVLYELLCGRPPFKGSMGEVLRQVQTEEPPAPRRLRPRLHRDLETICLKAMAKDPGRRYQSATALAEDLDRFNAGETILARREGAIGKVWRKTRRHPAMAAAVAIGLVGILTAGYVFWLARADREITDVNRRIARTMSAFEARLGTENWEGKDLDREVEELEALIAEMDRLSPDQAESARTRFQQSLARFVEEALRKPGSLQKDDLVGIDRALTLLESRAPSLAAPLRGARNKRYREPQKVFDLESPFTGFDQVFPGQGIRVQGSALIHESDRDLGGATVLTSVASSGNLEFEVELDESVGNAHQFGLLFNASRTAVQPTGSSIFSPDGRTVATGSNDGAVKLWDTGSGDIVKSLPGHKGKVHVVVYAPDGKTLASGGEDGTVKIWDASTGKELDTLRGHNTPVLCVAFSNDGRLLASISNASPGILWEVINRKVLAKFDAGTSVALSPDGKSVAHGYGAACSSRLWHFKTEKAERQLDGQQWKQVTSLAFAPDGKTVAAASECGSVALFDAATGKIRTILFRAHVDQVWSVAFSPDGQLLATGHGDGTIKVWDLMASYERSTQSAGTVSGVELAVFRGEHRGRVTAVSFAPDGARIASWCPEGTMQLSAVPHLTGQAHSFLVSTRHPSSTDLPAAFASRPQTLASLQKSGGDLRLQVLRNGALQREETVRIGPGSLRLRVSREKTLLKFQVNNLNPVVFYDTLPFGDSAKNSFFGVYWPAGIRCRRLQAYRQPLPAPISALEKGDEAYHLGDFGKALTLYQEQVRTAGAAAAAQATRREAQCKAGLCQVALKRYEEADQAFERVAREVAGPGEPWPTISIFQLWLLRAESGRFQEAEELFAHIQRLHPDRSNFKEITDVIPNDVRRRIMVAYNTVGARLAAFVLFNPKLIDHLERAVAVGALFRDQVHSQLLGQYQLVWAYRLAGRHEKAWEVAKSAIQTFEDANLYHPGQLDFPWKKITYFWLQAAYGDPNAGLVKCASLLFESPGVFRRETGPVDQAALLMEHCRLHLALKKWKEAEDDLALFLGKLPAAQIPYQLYSSARLTQGFLLEQRGEKQKALEAWRLGLFDAWAQSLAPDLRDNVRQFNKSLAELILASLTDTLTDAQADQISAWLQPNMGFDSRALHSRKLFQVPSSVYRRQWQTRRGREYAKRIAFGELTWPEECRVSMQLCAAELIHQGAFPGLPSREQEDVVWQLVQLGHEQHSVGKVTWVQALPLAATWLDKPGRIFGWASVRGSLDPSLRGPLAYVFGKRYLHVFNKPPKDVIPFFQTALKDAPAGSSLHTLAQKELDALGPK